MSQTTWEKIEPESQHITLSKKKKINASCLLWVLRSQKIDKAPTSKNKHAIEKK